MTARVASLWRFPIKSHGREELDRVTLRPGACLPWDRTWAVMHERSRAVEDGWSHCRNFIRVAGTPALAAIAATLNEDAATVTLRHPDRPDLTFAPDRDVAAFLDWVRPLMPEGRAAPVRILRVPGTGFTDSAFPSVTLCNAASHRAVEGQVGSGLSIHRWRGNIWIDGLAPWEEFGWIGHEVRIGAAVLKVSESAQRCETTSANPETGRRDADVLGALDAWGHRDFSVLAEITEGGEVATGDAVVLR